MLDLLTQLWPGVLCYIVDIDNISATRALNGITPSEKLLGSKPDVSKIKVCGSFGFVHVPKEKQLTKLSETAAPRLLLGFAQVTTGYSMLNLRTGNIMEDRDVLFREDVTVSKQHVTTVLKGQCGIYDTIPFVPLPVEYVAKEGVHSGAAHTVEADLPRVDTAEHKERAANYGTYVSGGPTSSSSDESEVNNEKDSAHNSLAAVQGAAGTDFTRSVPVNANASARIHARTRRASS